MSAEPQANHERRWSRAEIIGALLVIWMMAALLFAILTTKS